MCHKPHLPGPVCPKPHSQARSEWGACATSRENESRENESRKNESRKNESRENESRENESR